MAPGTEIVTQAPEFDTESCIYLPLLEEWGCIPKEKYAYAKEIFELVATSRDFLAAGTPGYYNNEGDVSAPGLFDQIYASGINKFNPMLAEWRERGDFEGLRLYK